MVNSFRYFVVSFISICNLVACQQSRSQVTLIYEYQLEVFQLREEHSLRTTNDYVNSIDYSLLDGLQRMLPNNEGSTNNSSQIPNVKFVDVSSEIYSACFTSSDECSLVRSHLVIAHEGGKPNYSVERVATKLVRDYLNNYSETNDEVTTTYVYPFWVESGAEFQLQPVDSVMTEIEIEVMEESILEVFGAVVFAMEGDTEMLDSKFTYQHLQQPINTSTDIFSREQRSLPMKLKVDFDIVGLCRKCSKEGFAGLVETVTNSNLGAFRNKLRVNGRNVNSTYFDNVETILFAFPSLPDELPPIEDYSVYDSEPPQSSTSIPWYVYFGFIISICILLTGMYVIRTDLSDLKEEKDKDHISTASESNNSSHSDDDDTTASRANQLEGGADDCNTSLEEYQAISYPEEHTESDYADPSYSAMKGVTMAAASGNNHGMNHKYEPSYRASRHGQHRVSSDGESSYNY